MTDTKHSKHFNDLLEGKKIAEARYMTLEEAESFGWYKRPLVLFFSDRSMLVFQKDDEGNDGGAAYYQEGENEEIIGTL